MFIASPILSSELRMIMLSMSYICLDIPEATHSFFYVFIHSSFIYLMNISWVLPTFQPLYWVLEIQEWIRKQSLLLSWKLHKCNCRNRSWTWTFTCTCVECQESKCRVQSAIEHTKEAPSFVCCLKQCFSEEVLLVGVTRKGEGGGRHVPGSRNCTEEQREHGWITSIELLCSWQYLEIQKSS